MLESKRNLQDDTGCLLQPWILQTVFGCLQLWCNALVCACVREQVVGETYCDDIQDAEEAVYTITWINLLHHTLFAILETSHNA